MGYVSYYTFNYIKNFKKISSSFIFSSILHTAAAAAATDDVKRVKEEDDAVSLNKYLYVCGISIQVH